MEVEDLTEEQQMLHQATTEFIEAQLPIAAGRALHEDPTGYPGTWFTGTAELGWYSMLIAEEYGGGSITGHGLLDLTTIADSVGRYLQPGPFLTMNVVGAAISEFGTEAHRGAVLPKIVAGELAVTWAPFDTAGRWDLGAGLRATLDGEHIVLSGARGYVTDAGSADTVLAVCELDGRPAQVLVDVKTAGVGVEPLSCFDLTRRVGELTFDGVRVPAGALLGSSTDGTAEQLERQLQIAVVLACADTVGALDAMFTMTVEYSKDRIAFGRPIGSFQALKHAMADQLLQLESCKAATAEAAAAVDLGSPEAAEIVSMAAAYVDEYASEIAQQSLQVHGGIGFTWEHDLHLFMRRIRVNTSMWCDKAWHYERLCEVCAL
ncbi:acyl-CoA/acyl-ACP dehydrogenase [Mycobacterium sp. MBM]|nr:acyl-CoA/acyl-ACP dehydrogenase [Mycobacterium sp. MBM]